jgi:quercetin dioxygenase-like cupin family protein
MISHALSELKEREVVPGYHGRFVHGDNVTVAFWTIDEGAALPEHAHVHEQVTMVTGGRFELTVAGQARVLEPGMAVVIPSNVRHSGLALTACQITDVFQPVREEYK